MAINDLATLLATADAWRAHGRCFSLATVVHVEGAAYRRPGARLLIADDGSAVGSVSGGCLEQDLRQKAEWQLGADAAKLVIYDRRDEDGEWGVGCQGKVAVLLERAGPPSSTGSAALAFLATCQSEERVGVLATVFRSADPRLPVGAHFGWVGRGDQRQCLCDVSGAPSEAKAAIDQAAATSRANDQSALLVGQTEGGTWEALIEVVRPSPHLFVFGGGEDALAVVATAKALGWRVSVSVPTRRWLFAARFAEVDAIHTGPPRNAARACAAGDRGAAVVMSHDYDRDRASLHELLGASVQYVGVLGPARRTARMLDDLRAAGRSPTEASLAALHAPAGLAIGAETPEELALAIVAEAQAVLTRQSAGFCRDAGRLHPRWPIVSASAGPLSHKLPTSPPEVMP